MIDRGGLVRWRSVVRSTLRAAEKRYQVRREEDSFVCSLLFFVFFFFFSVPRRGYSSGVFCFLDETIGPKQERK